MSELDQNRSTKELQERSSEEVLAFPLSFAQQRLWVLDQLEGNTAAYVVPIALRISGPLAVKAVKQTLAEIVSRHDALRATFEKSSDDLRQIIWPARPLAVPLADFSTLPYEEAVRRAEALVSEESQRPMDLAGGALLRALLVKLADQEHVLLITIHHMCFDGSSQRVLLHEFRSLYQDFVAGRSPSLPQLPLQYTDYVVWQRQFMSGQRLDQQIAYWKERLAGAPATLDLPTDLPRPPRQSFRGATTSITIPPSTIQQLQEFSRGEGVTLFMTLLAAFNVLLSRYSGQQDIVVGSPIAGRNRVELEPLIGLFVNTLPLRTELSGDPTVHELLQRVRETMLTAYAHQEVPFEKIVEELKPERDLSRNPIFQVMFVFQNMPREQQPASSLRITPFAIGARTTAKFDLLVTAAEKPDGLRFTFEYCTDLFHPATIERMQQHLRTLLESFAADPQRRVSQLPLLSAAEQEELLNRFNDTATTSTDLCLHQFFEQQVARTPDAIAAVCGKNKLSYAELNRRADQLAAYLRSRGVGPEILVGVCLERSLDLLVALLAILKAGGAYVPIDPAYPRYRIECILQDSAAQLMITEESLLGHLAVARDVAVCIDRDWPVIASASHYNSVAPVQPANLAYVLFTSGSTGRPKGVALEHRSAANFVHWAQRVFSREELAGTLFSTSVCFDLSIFEMFVPWSVGGTVIVADNVLALPEMDNRRQVTLINTVPSAIAELVETQAVPGSVLTINLAGEALAPQLVREIYQRTSVRAVYNLYGPTEATTYATYTRVGPEGDVTIGRPIANTQAYILDGHFNLVPRGAVGELFLGGAGVARGYFGQPELTAERFVANPFSAAPGSRLYRTGDLCRHLPDGNIEYLGRRDHQVKLRGFRIELAEVESALERHEGVQQAVVIVDDIGGEKRLLGYVTCKPGHELSVSELRRHLEPILPAYMIPSDLVVLEKFPLTTNGKIDRKALPRPSAPVPSAAIAPRNELEKLLVQIWQRVLRVPAVGIKDNFFDLGGHSLLAVRLLSEIRKETGRDLPLAALFQGATVEFLARKLRERQDAPHEMVVAVQAEGSRPPFFGVVVPGANPLGYVALARHLGNNQPLYEIQGPGPRLRGRPYSVMEFEQLAAQYIRAMKQVQPKGPYYFGGMCEGARIAFDMARLLEADGEKVGLLAILDTWVLENSQNRLLWKIDYYSGRLKSFYRGSPKEKWRALRRWAENRYGSERPERLWPKTYWPGKDFVPPKFSGKITVFKVPRQPFYYVRDPLMGWGMRTTAGVELQIVESKHLSLLREPYVRALAPKLAECLRRSFREAQEQEQQEHRQPVRETALGAAYSADSSARVLVTSDTPIARIENDKIASKHF